MLPQRMPQQILLEYEECLRYFVPVLLDGYLRLDRTNNRIHMETHQHLLQLVTS